MNRAAQLLLLTCITLGLATAPASAQTTNDTAALPECHAPAPPTGSCATIGPGSGIILPESPATPTTTPTTATTTDQPESAEATEQPTEPTWNNYCPEGPGRGQIPGVGCFHSHTVEDSLGQAPIPTPVVLPSATTVASTDAHHQNYGPFIFVGLVLVLALLTIRLKRSHR